MSRCIQLATKESSGLLITSDSLIVDFLCHALRGGESQWQSSISPGDFQNRCNHHGVEALLYHSIYEREEWSQWPESVKQSLELANKAGVAGELLRIYHLKELLQALSSRGLDYLLIKGEALANSHYPIPGTRPRCDSDLFVRIGDIEQVERTCLENGFVIVSSRYKSHQFTVRRAVDQEDGAEFDIHWRILNAPRYARSLSFDDVFSRSVKLAGLDEARSPNAVDALQLACMHRAGSSWHDQNRLIWIYDIHLLVSSLAREDMARFSECAVEKNIQEACLDGLNLSCECFGTTIPAEVLAMLATPEKRHPFSYSNLGLLIDDWRFLPTNTARTSLLRELFAPSAESLLTKYNKQDRRWLPLLYFRQIFAGLAQRITLR